MAGDTGVRMVRKDWWDLPDKQSRTARGGARLRWVTRAGARVIAAGALRHDLVLPRRPDSRAPGDGRDVQVRLGPRVSDLSGERLTQPLLERPEQRRADRVVLRVVHAILDVAPAEIGDLGDQR